MNINQLAKSLGDRAVALELITWLRENELLADNSGNITTDPQLAIAICFVWTRKQRNTGSGS